MPTAEAKNKRITRRKFNWWLAATVSAAVTSAATKAALGFTEALNAYLSTNGEIVQDIPPFTAPDGRQSERWYRWQNTLTNEDMALSVEKRFDEQQNPFYKAVYAQNQQDGRRHELSSAVIKDGDMTSLPLNILPDGRTYGLVGFYRKGPDIYYNPGFITTIFPSPNPPSAPTPAPTSTPL